MLGLFKVTWPALGTSCVLAHEFVVQNVPQGILGWVNLAAIATIVAGIFVVARYRAALEASDKAGSAISRERDAEHERAERLQGDVSSWDVQIAQIQAELDGRPDLEAHQRLLERMLERSESHAASAQRRDELLVANLTELTLTLKEIRTAVVPPDRPIRED